MRRHSGTAAILAALAFGGCQSSAGGPRQAASQRSAEPAAPAVAEPPNAQQMLDRLDSRAPVPLLPMMANHQKANMRDHLLVVQEITLALARSDFSGVERAAKRIGSSEQMTRMCEHMGSHAAGFTQAALGFHTTADSIVDAAKREDRDGVLGALGRTLTACTSCHASFKQQVVDEATWASVNQRTP